MSSRTGAVDGVDGICLLVEGGSVTLRCDTHSDFAESYMYGIDHRVPASWVVGVLTQHLRDHGPALEEPAGDDPAPVAATASRLEEFGREVASRCRWAMEFNQGDPDDEWPEEFQIAVALVLGNLDFLRSMEPGPGYTPQQAVLRLWAGIGAPPVDPGVWMAAIRVEITSPGDGRLGALGPGSGFRIVRDTRR